jgi:hypothetical protein
MAKITRATLKIELTPQQREQVKRVLGKDVTELELTPEALEERVAPAGLKGMSELCATHNC